ncbi:MAG: penicillin-binding transpeptidase domain-containing protein [Candidatus Wallbacteria bacterium]|nr:penicillin-binding transpeptidase domain-containing protein [Candidatus Wallbacteria bacterium]
MKPKQQSFISMPRLVFYLLILSLCFSYVIYMLFVIQFQQHEKWVETGRREYNKRMKVTKRRGDIYDARMNKLATSEPGHSIFIDPQSFSQKQLRELLEKVCPLLDLDSDKLIKKLSPMKNCRFYWLKRRISEQEHAAVKDINTSGFYIKREYFRNYPERSLACQVLGFVGVDNNDVIDNKGLEGLEYAFDSTIAGRFMYLPADMELKSENDQSPSIALTIDSVIQHICESALESAHDQFQSKNGQILVMEPKTGRILAMANLPGFDPNHYQDFQKITYKNRVVSDIFEPGSSFKPIAMSAALEEKKIAPGETFLCEGRIIVDSGKPVKCNRAHGEVTPAQIITYSCNPGIVQIAFRLGAENMYRYLDSFGFLEPAGPDFPNSPSSMVKPWNNWYTRDLASIAFGNAIAVTGLHLTMAFCAIANGGIMMQPLLIEKIIDGNGKIIQEFKPQIKNKSISPETASLIMPMLENAVSEGTGKKALIKGYSVAGKTGTPQKLSPDGGYAENKYISVFVGVIPSDNPRIVVYVQLDDPNTEIAYGGGTVAAPVFAEVGEKIMRYMEVFPKIEPQAEEFQAKKSNAPRLAPNFIGLSFKEVEMEQKSSGLKLKLRGDGELVIFQLPKPETPINENTWINLYLGERNLYEKLYNKGNDSMPNFIGKTLKEVVNLLKGWNNPVKIIGHGMVEFQSPVVGTKLTPTMEIEVHLTTAFERKNLETQHDQREIPATGN